MTRTRTRHVSNTAIRNVSAVGPSTLVCDKRALILRRADGDPSVTCSAPYVYALYGKHGRWRRDMFLSSLPQVHKKIRRLHVGGEHTRNIPNVAPRQQRFRRQGADPGKSTPLLEHRNATRMAGYIATRFPEDLREIPPTPSDLSATATLESDQDKNRGDQVQNKRAGE